MRDCNIEPASWFKVLVLDSVCVDCSEHVITWSVPPPPASTEGSLGAAISQAVSRRIALEGSTKLGRSPAGATPEVPPRPDSPSALQSKSASELGATQHWPERTSNSAPCSPRPERSTQPSSPSPLVTSCPPQPSDQPDSPSPLTASEPSMRPLRLDLQSSVGAHSLMAPHEGEASLCLDNLSSLFELAEALFRVNPSYVMHARDQDVEQRSWLRLLHCYLLPLISLHQGDAPAVESAHSAHQEVLASLDSRILEGSSEVIKMKHELVLLRGQLMPVIRQWVESGRCLPEFLSLFSSDLRQLEEEARSKVQSALKSMELFRKLSTPISEETQRRMMEDRQAGQVQLMETLELRGAIERILALRHTSHSSKGAGQWVELQKRYIEAHGELTQLRQLSAELSKKKVLALSVREALDQTLESLRSGRITTGIDVGLHGGHSTDVLAEASLYSAREECTTLKDKIQRLLQVQSSPASLLHQSFCEQLRKDYFPAVDMDFVMISQHISHESFQFRAMTLPSGPRRSPEAVRHWSMKTNVRHKRKPLALTKSAPLPDLREVAQGIREHFDKVVSAVCEHFNDNDVDFLQQVWLCYERLFFEGFSNDFIPLYQSHHAKFCEQLQLNSLSSSVVDPRTLNLAITEEAWLDFFQPRPFEEAVQLHQELTDKGYLKWNRSVTLPETELWTHFGGVASDLFSLPPAISPLEKLQLLTSAFRKATVTLSKLKAKPTLQMESDVSRSSSVMDGSQMSVSCDDLLPLLVLVLLQLPPSLLANLFLQCCFLDDYMAPFLSAGWHGYSLAAFRSALQVIAEL